MVARLSIDARRRQAVSRLKLLHRRDDGGIVFAGHAAADEVAGNFEAPLQGGDGLAGRAGLHHRRRNHGPAALGDDALIVLDRGLGRRDVGAGECRCAERRIGDPGLRRGIAFLGRKLVAMEGARSGLLRLPLAAAEQAAALAAEQATTLIVIVGISRTRRPEHPVGPSSKRTGRRWRAGCCRGEEPRPSRRQRGCPRLSVEFCNFSIWPLPVRCGFCPCSTIGGLP